MVATNFPDKQKLIDTIVSRENLQFKAHHCAVFSAISLNTTYYNVHMFIFFWVFLTLKKTIKINNPGYFCFGKSETNANNICLFVLLGFLIFSQAISMNKSLSFFQSTWFNGFLSIFSLSEIKNTSFNLTVFALFITMNTLSSG